MASIHFRRFVQCQCYIVSYAGDSCSSVAAALTSGDCIERPIYGPLPVVQQLKRQL